MGKSRRGESLATVRLARFECERLLVTLNRNRHFVVAGDAATMHTSVRSVEEAPQVVRHQPIELRLGVRAGRSVNDDRRADEQIPNGP